MEANGGHRGARGVGIAYHPFLHDYLLERVALFDFIELPLDLYLDPARAGLLDPGQQRLRQVAATACCVWRGSALSLGTVESSGEVGFAPHLLHRMRDLLGMVEAAHYTETLAFKSGESGALYALPFTQAAARWVAARQAAACAALAVPVQLCLPDSAIPAPSTGRDVADFLSLVASFGGTGFVLDAAGLGRADSHDGVITRLPTGQIAAITVSSDDAADWDAASVLAGRVYPRSIVLRRDRQLFPLDTIERDLRRAAQRMAEPAAPAALGTVAAAQEAGLGGTDQEDLAALHDYQLAVADTPQDQRIAASSSWKNWRTQVDDMHTVQQIMALTMRVDARSAPPGPL